MKRKQKLTNALVFTVLLIGALIMIIPFLWMISTAFKSVNELNTWPPSFIPKHFNFDNFTKVFQAAPFHLYFLNSVKMAVLSSLAIVFTSLISGYIFAKYRYFGLAFLFAVILATAIVPFEIYMIPLYLEMQKLDLLNKFGGLVLPYLVLSFGIFFIRQNVVQQIPDEVMEAARIDGLSDWGIFFKIVIPLMIGPMSALGIFAFIEAWNAFTWPLLVVGDQSKFTMELGLAVFQSSFTVDMTMISAASLISIIPILAVYLLLRRHIIESISMTGGK
ncbi:carbohydrate ABC transporter permease [Cohnella pontilimi]|uniref:Carbohydrate ABC transporter permease n=1 Tax=Cohnella pontilimi TaxID=2564100 RepID=A0A4U0FBZ5_9BACL|nr:carbohydrate ABC transporter permease [Cohnella pontilimi]TJY40742.1 carbohydrate ABC transporter permease [Cohnella pontilimi]